MTADVTPLLTVITVCLNRADTIAAALDSVVRQDRGGPGAGDIEHLVVDGVSTDGTLAVVARYPHARVVSEPDKGLYDAMNKGVRLARGRYVCLLNSDDELADGVIAAARTAMEAGADVVCFGTDIQRTTASGQREVIATIVSEDAIVLSPATATLGSPLLNAKMFRREFLQAVGEFDLAYRLASDVDLMLRLGLAKPRVAVLPIVGHHYLEHAGSLTINASDTGGRRAAQECLAIAEAALRRRDLSSEVRFLMRAFRGGKILALSNLERRAAGQAASWLHGLRRSRDVAAFAAYLLRRKLRSPQQRFAAELTLIEQSPRA